MAITGRNVGVLYTATESDALTGQFVVDYIKFTSSTKGDTCQVQNSGNQIVYRGGTPLSSWTDMVVFAKGKHMSGITIGTLDGGYVEIGLH